MTEDKQCSIEVQSSRRDPRSSILNSRSSILNPRSSIFIEGRNSKMKRFSLVVALIVLVAVTAMAQEHGKKAGPVSKAEEEVLKIDTERAEAYMHGDTAALERILADDVTYVHPTGKVETKAEILA